MFVFSLGNSLTSAISPSTAGENLGFVVEEWHTSGNERRVVGVAEEQQAQVSLFDVVVVVDFFFYVFSCCVHACALCAFSPDEGVRGFRALGPVPYAGRLLHWLSQNGNRRGCPAGSARAETAGCRPGQNR